MVVIGVDTHTRSHSAAAIDGQGRVLAEIQIGAGPYELRRLARWIAEQGPERLVAIEGAHGLGLALTRVLLAAGERIVGVACTVTAEGRRAGPRRGKDDPGDAIVVARVALRGERVPAVDAASLDDDLKLLVDARDQLVAEACRARNRLHALLLVMAPGYRESTGALASKRALAAARRLALGARARDGVRCRLAPAAVRRLLRGRGRGGGTRWRDRGPDRARGARQPPGRARRRAARRRQAARRDARSRPLLLGGSIRRPRRGGTAAGLERHHESPPAESG